MTKEYEEKQTQRYRPNRPGIKADLRLVRQGHVQGQTAQQVLLRQKMRGQKLQPAVGNSMARWHQEEDR